MFASISRDSVPIFLPLPVPLSTPASVPPALCSFYSPHSCPLPSVSVVQSSVGGKTLLRDNSNPWSVHISDWKSSCMNCSWSILSNRIIGSSRSINFAIISMRIWLCHEIWNLRHILLLAGNHWQRHRHARLPSGNTCRRCLGVLQVKVLPVVSTVLLELVRTCNSAVRERFGLLNRTAGLPQEPVLHIRWHVTQWLSIKVFADDSLYRSRVFLLVSSLCTLHRRISAHALPVI